MKGLQLPSEVQNEQSEDRSQGDEEGSAIHEAVEREQNNIWLEEICLKYGFVMLLCLVNGTSFLVFSQKTGRERNIEGKKRFNSKVVLDNMVQHLNIKIGFLSSGK